MSRRLTLVLWALLAAGGCDDAPAEMVDMVVDHGLDAATPDLGTIDATSDAARLLDGAVDGQPDGRIDASARDASTGDASPIDGGMDGAPDGGEGLPDSSAVPMACTRPALVAGEVNRTLYVGQDGQDATGDGSRERPFGTLPHAAGQAEPGTAVRLLPGVYRGGIFLRDVRGEPGAPIVIGGVPGEPRPVIDASGQSEGLHLIRPRWVILEHLTVRSANDNGINVDDGGEYANPEAARHLSFRGLLVEQIGPNGNRDCLKLSGLDDFEVRESTFRGCGDRGSGVDMVGCHDGFIANNSFSDLGASGVQAKGGTARVRIANNRFVQAGARPVNMGGSTGLMYFRPPVDANQPNAEARRIEVVSNLFIGGETAAALVGCVSCVFAHNTVVEPDAWLLRVLQETTTANGLTFEPVRDGWVTGNIFLFERGQIRRGVNIGPNTAAESFRFTHNLFFASDNPEGSDPQPPGQQVGSIIGQAPRLDADRRPMADSPALGAGDPDAHALLEATLDGHCYSDPPTLGALAPVEQP